MQKPMTVTMNDRDLATECLMSLKQLNVSYATALNEASIQPLFEEIRSIQQATQQAQHTLYHYMKGQQWYNPAAAPLSNVQQQAQKAIQDQQQLPH